MPQGATLGSQKQPSDAVAHRLNVALEPQSVHGIDEDLKRAAIFHFQHVVDERHDMAGQRRLPQAPGGRVGESGRQEEAADARED
ncbi:hypothetical protein AURDEDRAFT_161757 [Auricularia subglabra TFB-10046 SS5]|nr:hypothetical protein AURDEDRAFT_161757 [Auricularia subglabra TFB-10046 SS5]